jgi:hypothetical protein
MALSVFPRGTRIPKINPKFLEPDTPQIAINADPESGNLSPLKGLLQAAALTKAGELRSIFKLGSAWLTWTNVVDVVKAQIPGSDDRFFYTGDGVPKQSNMTMATSGAPSTYPTSSYDLGVPAPTSILTTTFAGTADASLTPKVVSYVYTYVTVWGEESAPSTESPVAEVEGGRYIYLTNFINPANSRISHIRVYRIEVGTSGSAEYQLVKVRPSSLGGTPVYDIPIATIASTSTRIYDANHGTTPTGLSEDLGEVIPSEDWAVPPTNLANLTQFMNGIMVGSSDTDVCISEPMIPYAWPVKYRQTLDYPVVGLGVFNSTIIALTTAYPYRLQGSDPARVSLTRLEYKQGCVSKRGIVTTPAGVIYPSPDGLFMVDDVAVRNLTTSLFTAEQWAALGPQNLIGFLYDDAYYGFFQGTGRGLVITIDAVPVLQEFDLGVAIYGGHVDPVTNTLVLLGKPSTYYIYNWGEGASLPYTWTTMKFSTSPTNWSVAQIKGPFDAGSITFTPILGGTRYPAITVSNDGFFWLPSGILYRDLEVEVQGLSQIDQILIAHHPEELSNV